jgi:hypothetical protein
LLTSDIFSRDPYQAPIKTETHSASPTPTPTSSSLSTPSPSPSTHGFIQLKKYEKQLIIYENNEQMSVSFVFLSKYFKLLIVYEPKILNYQADINIPSDIHRAKDKISYLYQ